MKKITDFAMFPRLLALGGGGRISGKDVRKGERDMPIVHQDKGFDFTIKPEDKDPPKVYINGAKEKRRGRQINIPSLRYNPKLRSLGLRRRVFAG